jgi:D-Tyr-tRNAtyr deacylase
MNAPCGVNRLFVFTEDKGKMDEKQIYTDKEASNFLRISQVTLWRERKKGKISFRRVASKIVYLREDLEKYLERNKREAFAQN